jgi:hypothetical protein
MRLPGSGVHACKAYHTIKATTTSPDTKKAWVRGHVSILLAFVQLGKEL